MLALAGVAVRGAASALVDARAAAAPARDAVVEHRPPLRDAPGVAPGRLLGALLVCAQVAVLASSCCSCTTATASRPPPPPSRWPASQIGGAVRAHRRPGAARIARGRGSPPLRHRALARRPAAALTGTAGRGGLPRCCPCCSSPAIPTMSWNGLSFTPPAELSGRAAPGTAIGLQKIIVRSAPARAVAFGALVAATSWSVGVRRCRLWCRSRAGCCWRRSSARRSAASPPATPACAPRPVNVPALMTRRSTSKRRSPVRPRRRRRLRDRDRRARPRGRRAALPRRRHRGARRHGAVREGLGPAGRRPFEPGLPPAEPYPLHVRSGDPRVDVQAALAMLAPEWGFEPLIDIADEQARDHLARASVMALSLRRPVGARRRPPAGPAAARSTRRRRSPSAS